MRVMRAGARVCARVPTQFQHAPATCTLASHVITRNLSTASSAPRAARRMTMDELISHCKHRGFVYVCADVYGSIGTGYDYGPFGAQLKKNVQSAWWRDFIERRPDCVPLESCIIMNPRVWQASGHVERFVDPVTECASCRKRVRADKLIDSAAESHVAAGGNLPAFFGAAGASGMSLDELHAAVQHLGICCPECKATGEKGLQKPRMFNLLFDTRVGPTFPEDDTLGAKGGAAGARHGATTSRAFLRPETAQGVYVNFTNVVNSTRRRLPLGIGQVGKSFRNEVAVGNFVFRTREFDQMELQYFVHPDESQKWFDYWIGTAEAWLHKIGLSPENVRRRPYDKGELAHYALATTDLQFKFPFGWDELWGIANRGNYDLRAHSAASGHELVYHDTATNKSFFPHAIEPALGVNRLLLAILSDACWIEPQQGTGGDATRMVMRLSEELAPYRAAVLPVVKNNAELVRLAQDLQASLLQHFPTDFDATQSIGKRYRRQDEVGTPYCLTVDNTTLTDGTVTVRDRDSMKQVRMHKDELISMAAANAFNMKSLRPRFEAH